MEAEPEPPSLPPAVVVAVPRGDGDRDFHNGGEEEGETPPLTGLGPRRRRPREGRRPAAAAAALLVALAVAGSLAASTTATGGSPARKGRDALAAARVAASVRFGKLSPAFPPAPSLSWGGSGGGWPRLSRRLLEGAAESAELAWEKSENAFGRLGRRSDEGEKAKENPLERALEGIARLGQRGGNGNHDKRGSTNLRQRGGRNNSGSSSGDNKKRSRNSEGHGGGIDLRSAIDVVESHVRDLPPAAPLAALCAFAFLLASVLVRSDRRRRRGLARARVLDREEAEIVEFYEKEMEEGGTWNSPFASGATAIPFLQDTEECGRPRLKRAGSAGTGEATTTAKRHNGARSRSSSDSSPIRRAGEGRESCDLYYSRVLQDIENLDYEDDEGEEEEEEEEEDHDDEERAAPANDGPLRFCGMGECREDDRCQDEEPCRETYRTHNIIEVGAGEGGCAQEEGLRRCHCPPHAEIGPHERPQPEEEGERDEACRLSLFENVSSLTEDAEDLAPRAASAAVPSVPRYRRAPDEADEEDEAESFRSARCDRPPSPPSASSSVSSLTSEGYDEDENEREREGARLGASSADATPPRSNLRRDRRPNVRSPRDEGPLRSAALASPPRRTVSFSREVSVREIPPRGDDDPASSRRRDGEDGSSARDEDIISPERRLYLLLLLAGAIVAAFSLMPVRPLPSPMRDGAGGGAPKRAETMLSSQWELEL